MSPLAWKGIRCAICNAWIAEGASIEQHDGEWCHEQCVWDEAGFEEAA